MELIYFGGALGVGAFVGYRVGKQRLAGKGNGGTVVRILLVLMALTMMAAWILVAHYARLAPTPPPAGRYFEYLVAYGSLGLVCTILSYCLAYALTTEPEVINFDRDNPLSEPQENSFIGK